MPLARLTSIVPSNFNGRPYKTAETAPFSVRLPGLSFLFFCSPYSHHVPVLVLRQASLELSLGPLYDIRHICSDLLYESSCRSWYSLNRLIRIDKSHDASDEPEGPRFCRVVAPCRHVRL